MSNIEEPRYAVVELKLIRPHLPKLWREVCVYLDADFKYHQCFSEITLLPLSNKG